MIYIFYLCIYGKLTPRRYIVQYKTTIISIQIIGKMKQNELITM